MPTFVRSTLAALAAACTLAVPAQQARAEWRPNGPITLLIAFRAGGGADTQARLIAEELETRRGWKVLPENVTGKGGANMALTLKDQPADGLALGMAVVETFAYNAVAIPDIGYSKDDFTFLTTTAPTQMGVVAKADSGWKTLEDLAKTGRAISFSTMSPRLEDGAYLIAEHFGFDVNTVSVAGGKGSLNAIVAGDVDVGFVAGIQTQGVESGDLLNLVSAESSRLDMSPDTPTLQELGIPFDFGAQFVMMAPAGLPEEARTTLTAAITKILQDENSKPTRMIRKAFGPPLLISGEELDAFIADAVASADALLKAVE